MKWLRSFGPGVLVTAAFIGPGTVTTASVAGARFGYTLLWAIAFSVFAAIVLQEMSARMGLVTRRGLGEALRSTFARTGPRVAVSALVIAAIAVGNGAYQMGNITGASIGLEALTGLPQQLGKRRRSGHRSGIVQGMPIRIHTAEHRRSRRKRPAGAAVCVSKANRTSHQRIDGRRLGSRRVEQLRRVQRVHREQDQVRQRRGGFLLHGVSTSRQPGKCEDQRRNQTPPATALLSANRPAPRKRHSILLPE